MVVAPLLFTLLKFVASLMVHLPGIEKQTRLEEDLSAKCLLTNLSCKLKRCLQVVVAGSSDGRP